MECTSTGVSDSGSERSRHSSIKGPYRQGSDTSGFPTCYLHHPGDEFPGDIYSRSMLSTGEGYFLWDNTEHMNRPAEHLNRGVGIGDVGILDEAGHFRYFFNIFHSRSDPIQTHRLPNNFEPIQPTLDGWEVRKSPTHFAPGTALVSEGINISEQGKSPLKLRFTTSALEGGILVLPNGASRQDLVVTRSLLEYIKGHAVDWYQSLGCYETKVTERSPPNGTLYLITGSDSANSWATAGFPRRCWNAAMPISIAYDSEEKDPWMNSVDAGTKSFNETENSGICDALVIRGLRVALSGPTWLINMPSPDPDITPVYRVQNKALYSYRAKWEAFLAKYFGPPNFSVDGPTCPYHPSNLILQMLFVKTRNASVAVVDDKIWCSALNKRNPTYPELLKVLPRLFEDNDVVVSNGIVTLVPKPNVGPEPDPGIRPVGVSRIPKPAFVERALRARAAKQLVHSSVKFRK